MALAGPDLGQRERVQARLDKCSETPFDSSQSLAYGAFSSDARISIAGTDCSHLCFDLGSTYHVFMKKDHFVEYDPDPIQHSFIHTVESLRLNKGHEAMCLNAGPGIVMSGYLSTSHA